MRKFFLFICIPFYWKGHKKWARATYSRAQQLIAIIIVFFFFLESNQVTRTRDKCTEKKLKTGTWGQDISTIWFLKKGRGGHVTWWNKADDRTSFEFYNNLIFFVHTNFLIFLLKSCGQGGGSRLFQEVVLSYRHNCSRKKNGKLVSLLKTYFFRE
jgi:hypothetical protein